MMSSMAGKTSQLIKKASARMAQLCQRPLPHNNVNVTNINARVIGGK
ncbi:MAG: hypothetical protein HC804_07950 [Anaerolineae bacterium]|nr:hypothetical protein [Anaerolineae bacterium]